MVKKKTTDEFINESIQIHGNKYDYNLVEYIRITGKVEIVCKTHGSFYQVAHDHLQGKGCPICGRINADIKRRKKLDKFILQAKSVHGEKYDYSRVKYVTNKTPVIIVCPDHGEYQIMPQNHLRGYGCSHCSCSVGENSIKRWLDHNEINYVFQKRFKTCRKVYPLPFDFYIPSFNLLIEYDGRQHYYPVEFWGGEDKYIKTVENDNIKTKWVEDNSLLHLERIKYNEDVDIRLCEIFKSLLKYKK